MIVNLDLTTGCCLIERHEAEAFLTLVEELHFGRAAERMRVSTAQVSQVISKLERQVGVPLFRRTSRRVELTPVGRQLHDELRPAWQGMAAAMRHAIETGRGRRRALRCGQSTACCLAAVQRRSTVKVAAPRVP